MAGITYEYTTVEAADAAIEESVKEILGEFAADGVEVCGDEAYHDILLGTVHSCTSEVARELCRMQLGFVPDQVEQMIKLRRES